MKQTFFAALLCLNSITFASTPFTIHGYCSTVTTSPNSGGEAIESTDFSVSTQEKSSYLYGMGYNRTLLALSEVGNYYLFSLSEVIKYSLSTKREESSFRGITSSTIMIYPESNGTYSFTYYDPVLKKMVTGDSLPETISIDYTVKNQNIDLHRKASCTLNMN